MPKLPQHIAKVEATKARLRIEANEKARIKKLYLFHENFISKGL